MKKAFSDQNEPAKSQTDNQRARGGIRLLTVFVCLLIACTVIIGVLVAWLISLYHVPYVTGDRDLDREIDVCVSEHYDDYKVLGLVNVRQDKSNIADFCVVETDDGLHLGRLALDLFTGDHILSYNEIVNGMEMGVAYEAEDGAMAHIITCGIYDRQEDVPADALQTDTLSTDRGTVYFCVIKIAEITRE